MGDRRNHFVARAHHARAATQFAFQLVRRAPHRRDSDFFLPPSRRVSPAKSAPLRVQLPASRSRRCFLTCLVFLIVGWTAPPYFVTALSIGGIVCIASSNGGTTSQDLKTGFLIGSTPKYQQIAILIGTLASCLVIGPILMKLNESGTVYIPVAGNKDFSLRLGVSRQPSRFRKGFKRPTEA